MELILLIIGIFLCFSGQPWLGATLVILALLA
jgi:hypothetical protein